MAGEYFESDSCDQCGDTEVGVIVFDDTKGYGVASVCWQCLVGAVDTLRNGELERERRGVTPGDPMIQVTCVERNDVGAIYEVQPLQLQYSWVTTPGGPFVVLRPVHDQGDENWVWYGEEAEAIHHSLEQAVETTRVSKSDGTT